jgi:hypothetical protein
MSVTLARRIRRIGLLPSTKDEKGFRVRNVDPELTPEAREAIARQLRLNALAARIVARQKQSKPKPVAKKAA